MTQKSATMFSGGEGVGLGMMAAGFSHAWGIEYDDKIASVARDNGFNVLTANILECNAADFEAVDWLHASPPCPNFSNAKANAEETENDAALAAKVCEFIAEILPRVFTLENVYGYRKSKSWQSVAQTLLAHGYQFNYWHVNMADYGIITKCPIHHVLELTRKNANGAEVYLNHVSKMKTAQDIVQLSARMQVGAQAKILAWDAVAELAQTISMDIAADVTLKKWVKKLRQTNLEKTTLTGRVESLLTAVVTSESEISGIDQDTQENIVWLLKKCLGGSSMTERLSTISTETLRTTAQKILGCLLTIPNTSSTTTKQPTSQMDGDQVTNGHSCPLCQFKGIPQTRKRMIVIARRDGQTPMLPPATHAENPVNSFFENKRPWIGWYEAIEDLIETLPDSQFAPWQLERLPDEYRESLMIKDGDNYAPVDNGRIPSYTLSTTNGSRAFIVNGTPNDNGARVTTFAMSTDTKVGMQKTSYPIQTVTATKNAGEYRAFIVPGGNASSFSVRGESEPARVVGDVDRVGNVPRAFFVQAANSKSNGKITNEQHEPAITVDTTGKPLAFTNGRVVKMTPRALARFQSFPDWYEFPDKASLACRIIGNSVPPKFMQHIGEWIQ